MKPTRREFLGLAGGIVAAMQAGCDRVAQLALEPKPPLDFGPWAVPAGDARDSVTRVLNRLTYGHRPGDYARVSAMGIATYIEEQLAPESIDDSPCDALVRRIEAIHVPLGELFEYKKDYLHQELVRAKMVRSVYSRRQLFEVMVEFWTDHFNIDSSKGDCAWLKAADDREVIRRHALGSFPAMLKASATSPAMLWYLDGRVNRRMSRGDRPNENYARELMELHTLGVDGGYTQEDVMEVARCLTGWTVRSEEVFHKGRVEFRPEYHDDGPKRVLGKTIPGGGGERDLDHVLEILCGHPSTARHLADKLCRRFIGEPPPEGALEVTATAFSRSGGDIGRTLRNLFATREFREASPDQIKRPFHFVASALRATGAETDGGVAMMEYLRRMGHVPYEYPTPDGYPMDAAPWTGTLLWRWHFAEALTANRIPGSKVDTVRLLEHFGGAESLMAHLLGRRPTEVEMKSYHASGRGPAVMLASPAFQRC